MEQITGKVYGPVNPATGAIVPGANDFASPLTANLAQSGLVMRMRDGGSSRNLDSNFVPCELLFSPGYGTEMYQPIKRRYLWRKTSKVEIDLKNRDTTAAHYFAIALIGSKITIG
jgi:hypothetical protein